MNTAAGVTWGARSVLANGLPEWAEVLVAECPGYVFSRCEVFRGPAVAAVRTTGQGPHVVITSDEAEMRAALGLPTSG